jgi:hypothetical protein
MRKTLVAVVLSLMTVTAAWGEDREVVGRKAAEVEVALDPFRKESLESNPEVFESSVLKSTLHVEETSMRAGDQDRGEKVDTDTICNNGIQALSCAVIFLLLTAFLYGLL